MRLLFTPYTLKFKEPAGTSRGVMLEKPTWFLRLQDEHDPSHFGIGEAAYFPGLSPEDPEKYVYKIIELLANVALGRATDLSRHPSLQFGFEQAILDYTNGGTGIYYPTAFTRGERDITINGLVWMGSKEEMLRRVGEKLKEGFACVKLKIGAIDWESELDILKSIRAAYPSDSLMIRVDANGAFTMDNVFPRLKALADLGVHSIEQPVKAGTPELMAFVCRMSPVPVALDEELIGHFSSRSKERLLEEIMPRFIILKPALVGGFSGAKEWIDLAEKRGIGWWITSALESNVGLNALAQWTATFAPETPQGLGTGALYTNNTPSRLVLTGDRLRFDTATHRDVDFFNSLDWRQ